MLFIYQAFDNALTRLVYEISCCGRFLLLVSYSNLLPNLFQGQVNFFCEGPLLLTANTALMTAVMASDNPWQVKALVSKYPMAPIIIV